MSTLEEGGSSSTPTKITDITQILPAVQAGHTVFISFTTSSEWGMAIFNNLNLVTSPFYYIDCLVSVHSESSRENYNALGVFFNYGGKEFGWLEQGDGLHEITNGDLELAFYI